MPLDIDEAVRSSYERVHRAALVITGNPWDADDLAQETFLEAMRSGHRFAGSAKPYTWLYAILLRRERRRRRRHRRWVRRLRELCLHLAGGAAEHEPADARLQVREWRESLWAHVARLTPAQRDVLVLRYSEDLTYAEIAEVLGCPEGTAKSRLHHAVRKLRQRLGAQHDAALQLDMPSSVFKKAPGESCYG